MEATTTTSAHMRTMSMADWMTTHKDYKTTIDKQRYILKLVDGVTKLVPVRVTTP